MRQAGVTFRNGAAEIQVWAPFAKEVSLQLQADGKRLPLSAEERGYWTLRTEALRHGDLYKLELDGSNSLPDPASRSQPEGVHGPSQALDLAAYQWSDEGWANILLEEYIIYELHTGTFTPEGTFAGIAAKLDYLKTLGITAIEIMPVAAFPGARNWGYDGVFPFAVQSSYGGAHALMDLVNAAHSKGLAVILDVVYNHVGPEGNYLGMFGPYFTDKYKTPWGSAINFDDAGCDAVRAFFIQNALMWLRDFHFDALRLDAVHAIRDFSAKHILQELREEVDTLMQATGRKHYLIVESDLNDVRFINPRESGGYGMDAQWTDEFHHALRVTTGQEPIGYYADFNGIAHLAKSYRDAYVYDGSYSPHRDRTFGSKTRQNTGQQFVVFSQNHDQVGNRMLGERTSSLLSFEMLKLMAAAVMVSPYIPLLFMGEEWAEPNPFLYFVSHTDPGLIEAVRKGRRAEFAAFNALGEAPDPQAEETFLGSKLQWDLPFGDDRHSLMFRFYQALIRFRKTNPALAHTNRAGVVVAVCEEEKMINLTRQGGGQKLSCLLNFSDGPGSHIPGPGRIVFDTASPDWGGPAEPPATTAGVQNTLTIQPESCLIYLHDV